MGFSDVGKRANLPAASITDELVAFVQPIMAANTTSPCFKVYGTPSCTKVSCDNSCSELRLKPYTHNIVCLLHQIYYRAEVMTTAYDDTKCVLYRPLFTGSITHHTNRVPPLLCVTNLRTFKHLFNTNFHCFGDRPVHCVTATANVNTI